ncbi:MAG: hypothetical protein ACT4O4_06180 [Nitrospiraceae bacterium]
MYFVDHHESLEARDTALLLMKLLKAPTPPDSSESRMTLESIISIGILGWLTVGMVLMGLGIW